MNGLEQRIKRLEEQGRVCNHHSPVVLANPTADEVERRKKELDECRSCKKHGRPKLVILTYPKFD
ncbi:MAG: hypothetical protein Q8S00_18005 [Deltaproteobacteria bacterium]|nr:hypothetical protein [Deltaproteobacteria bacterium]MDZ4346335.1 hypothetical protein [Candidatus Binatia bacterium]